MSVKWLRVGADMWYMYSSFSRLSAVVGRWDDGWRVYTVDEPTTALTFPTLESAKAAAELLFS